MCFRTIQEAFAEQFLLEEPESSDDDRAQYIGFAISRYVAEEDEDWDWTDGIGIEQNADDNPWGTDENDDTLDDTSIDTGPYYDLLVKSSAYRWLVASLQREATLTRTTPDLMEDIRTEILRLLPSYYKVSRNSPSQHYKATFEIAWDPLSFVKEQQYSESPDEALKRAITLTGTANDAQALTAEEYLSQTWSATGKDVMGLVTDVVRNTKSHHAICEHIIRLLLACNIY
jgi:hypothetical protein